MDTYLLGKLLHLLTVGVTFAFAGVIEFAFAQAKKAETPKQALASLGAVGKFAPKMPLFALLLFLTGAWLTGMHWSFKLPFVYSAITGLASMVIVGGAIMKPKLAALAPKLAQAGDGPMTPELRAALNDRGVSSAAHYPPIMALCIMNLMVFKPGLVGSVITLGVAILLAVASGGGGSPKS